MSFYRNAVWLVKGLREYTRSGYEAAAKHFVATDLDVDVSGRSFVITGANSGIGKATALEIAKRGGAVHLVCRNKDRAEEARAHIVEQSKNQNVHVHIVDMSSPRGLWEFANTFTQNHSVHVLINNAGCMVNQRELTDDGLEKNFATNTLGAHRHPQLARVSVIDRVQRIGPSHSESTKALAHDLLTIGRNVFTFPGLGTFILTTALIPALKKSQDPRVITVSSGGMLVQKLNPDDLQFEIGTFDGTMAYAQNKRQQVIMTEIWAQQHKEIHFSSMHPGWADTPAVQSSMPDFHAKMKNRLRTEAEGADTVVWLAVSDAALKHPNGLFFQDRTPVATHLPLAFTRSSSSEENELMNTLERLSAQFKPSLTAGL